MARLDPSGVAIRPYASGPQRMRQRAFRSLARRCAAAPCAILALAGLAACAPSPPATLTLATTTSTADSGLLDFLLPPFERDHKVTIQVVAAGTGQALEIGKRGDADLLIVHAPSQEERFVAEGHGVYYKALWHNDFVLLAPGEDPAGIRGLADASAAMRQIATRRAAFVSRGDNSGTHQKEKELWAAAGLRPDGPWYLSVGQGMGETLLLADEKGAYLLADRGTFLKFRARLRLEVAVEGDLRLQNPYHALVVNPERYPHVKYELAVKLVDYLTSEPTQRALSGFGAAEFGQAQFHPSSEEWRALQAASGGR